MPEGIFSPMHLLIILVIVFLLFGAKRLPELGKGLGSGIREFKSGLNELHSDDATDGPAQTAEQPLLMAAQVALAAGKDAGPAVGDAGLAVEPGSTKAPTAADAPTSQQTS